SQPDLPELVLYGDVWHPPGTRVVANPASSTFRDFSCQKRLSKAQPSRRQNWLSAVHRQFGAVVYRRIADADRHFSIHESGLERSAAAVPCILGACPDSIACDVALRSSSFGRSSN